MDSKNTTKPTQISPLWVVIGILATIPVVYFFARMGDPTFMDSTMGNWFATMVGVLIGIPIALYLSNWQQKQQEKKEQEAQAREAQARKVRILTLIRQELLFNRDALASNKTESAGTEKRVVFVDGLKDEVWSAFSDGGELEWIRDLELLHVISFAYHYIRRIVYLENLYMQATFLIDPHSVLPRQQLAGYLMTLDPITTEHIDRALASIDKAIKDQPMNDSD